MKCHHSRKRALKNVVHETNKPMFEYRSHRISRTCEKVRGHFRNNANDRQVRVRGRDPTVIELQSDQNDHNPFLFVGPVDNRVFAQRVTEPQLEIKNRRSRQEIHARGCYKFSILTAVKKLTTTYMIRNDISICTKSGV